MALKVLQVGSHLQFRSAGLLSSMSELAVVPTGINIRQQMRSSLIGIRLEDSCKIIREERPLLL
jgi:hypothetical protein